MIAALKPRSCSSMSIVAAKDDDHEDDEEDHDAEDDHQNDEDGDYEGDKGEICFYK